jgi:predicted nucleic acid-binding protein
VDASLAVKWLVEEKDSKRAAALGGFWRDQGTKPVAPHLMAIEVANALHRRVARGELSVATAARLVENLLTSGVELRETSSLYRRTLELALQLRQGAVYNSHYLALAESLNCDLWTADERFFRAAVALTPNIHQLGEFVTLE